MAPKPMAEPAAERIKPILEDHDADFFLCCCLKRKAKNKRPLQAAGQYRLSGCKQEADCNKPAGQKVGLFALICAKEK